MEELAGMTGFEAILCWSGRPCHSKSIAVIFLSGIPQSADFVPLKSLWESASSSEASSTTLRPPPIRRGVLPKEGSFPRLKCHRDINRNISPEWETLFRDASELVRVYLKTTRGCGWNTECTGYRLSTLVIFVTHLNPGSGKWVWFTATKPSTEKNMATHYKLVYGTVTRGLIV